MTLIQRLVPHLSRALGVMCHLRDSAFRMAASLAALDQLAGGVLLLDGARRVGFVNKAARHLAEPPGPIRLRHTSAGGRVPALRLADHLHTREAEFQAAMALAPAPPSLDTAAHFSQALILADQQGGPTHVVHVAPLAGDAANAAFPLQHSSPARAVMFIYDLGAISVTSDRLCSLFDFTPAEARACLQVLKGGSVAQMARRQGVSENTFKSQIRAVYAESATSRQADLLKLLLALSSG